MGGCVLETSDKDVCKREIYFVLGKKTLTRTLYSRKCQTMRMLNVSQATIHISNSCIVLLKDLHVFNIILRGPAFSSPSVFRFVEAAIGKGQNEIVLLLPSAF